MSDTITTEPESAAPPRKKWIVRHLLPITGIAVALVLGIGIGTAGKTPAAEAKPLPAKTVEVEVTDLACKKVALELFDQLDTMNNDVVLPLLNAGKAMNSELLAVVNGGVLALDIDALTGATADIRGANTTLGSLTTRIEAIGDDYLTCTD